MIAIPSPTGLSHSPDDEKKLIRFYTELNKIEELHHDYFKEKGIEEYFSLLSNKVPPAVRLRYLEHSSLDENIKDEVIKKYREIFGKDSDYQVIS